ncbi:MAG: carboxylesterase family protein [Gemmatimonadaceae bacterium]|nr:carboxylesterase family protein [Gemmatimonadaceae bacterium]
MIALILAVAAPVAPLHAQASHAAARDTAAVSGLVADVTGGKVRGAALVGGGTVFLGIPYARPPVGPLRWREPARVEAWTGIRDAAAYGPPCAQNPYFNPVVKETAREDCLYLNIWTPEISSTRGGRAVMVWIPGGGNYAGASGQRTSGEKLMRRNVVVVSLNYRLGLFGFFSHPDLTRESPHRASGNQGILDQIAALRWVQANIATFGGDPANVTIFGESAGSLNVSVLMTSPLSRGLFRRAIGQSGAVILAGEPLSLKDAESRGASLAETWGAGVKPSLATLRALPMAAILKAEPNFLNKPQPNLGIMIDGYVFAVRPSVVFAQGRQHRVAMLLGNLAHEWVPGVKPPANLEQAIEGSYPADAAKRALSLYMESGTHPLYGTPAEQWVGDTGFRCSAVAQLVWHATARNVAYEYQVEHLPVGRRQGNAHAQDIPYVFGKLDGEGYGAVDSAMSEVMQKYWTNFAKTGNPNGPGVPPWPSFDPTLRAYVAFTDEGAVAKKGLRRPFCDLFVENLRP